MRTYKILKTGLIFRGLKPVYWSPSARTALAESELEYRDDHESTCVFLKFKISQKSRTIMDVSGPVYAVVWTTTPWTIPGNKVGLFCSFRRLAYTPNWIM